MPEHLALIEEIIEWVRPAFRVAGYPIVFAAVLLERSILLGLVVPGEVILALGGLYAAAGELHIAAVIIGGTVAAIIGESAGFWLGHRYGEGLLRRLPVPRRMKARLPEMHDYFEERGGPTVVLGRMAVGVGAGVPFVAGMANMRYRTFIAWDAPAIAFWATGISLLGFLVGSNIDRIDRLLGRYSIAVTALFVLFVGVTLWRRRRRRQD